jgi:hypothetical protein
VNRPELRALRIAHAADSTWCAAADVGRLGRMKPEFAKQERREDSPMSTSYKPNNYSTVSPYLIVNGAAATIDFLKQVRCD